MLVARGHVLVLDDDLATRRRTCEAIERAVSIVIADTIAAAWVALSKETFDVVIARHDLRVGWGAEFLELLPGRRPHLARILLTEGAEEPSVRRLAATEPVDGLTLVFRHPVEPDVLEGWVVNAAAMARLARGRPRLS